MRQADEILTRFDVPHECRVLSAHRTPALTAEYADGRGGARPPGHHRRRRRRGASGRRRRRAHGPAGDWRPDAERGAQRDRLAAVHRADAERHSGGHRGDRSVRAPRTRGCSPSRFWPRRGPTSAPSCRRTARSWPTRCGARHCRKSILAKAQREDIQSARSSLRRRARSSPRTSRRARIRRRSSNDFSRVAICRHFSTAPCGISTRATSTLARTRGWMPGPRSIRPAASGTRWSPRVGRALSARASSWRRWPASRRCGRRAIPRAPR